jgi:hypothetical protein
MKATTPKLLALLLVLAVLNLAACESREASGSSESSEPSSVATESPSAEVPQPQSLLDESAIRAQFEQVAEACSDVTGGFSAGSTPALEDYSRMSEAIGALGFPVDYFDLDMPNADKVEGFWADVRSGKDAQVIIYRLNSRGITAHILENREHICTTITAFYYFQQAAESEASEITFDESVYTVDVMRLTGKGYLLYHALDPDGSEQYDGFRVAPLGEENRELGRKYLSGIGYMSDGLLQFDWDQDDYYALNMSWVFESLYDLKYGKRASDDYNEADGQGRVIVPSDVVEDVMQNYLTITTEQLHSIFAYSEGQGGYVYEALEGGGYAPRPEVVAVTENTDGSISLTVDAVAAELGDDQYMTSILTVTDNPEGSVKYLSNKVTKVTHIADFALGEDPAAAKAMREGDRIGDWTLTNLQIDYSNGAIHMLEANFQGNVTLNGTLSRSALVEYGFDFTASNEDEAKVPYYISPETGGEDRLMFMLNGTEELADFPSLEHGERLECNIRIRDYRYIFAHMTAPASATVADIEILQAATE